MYNITANHPETPQEDFFRIHLSAGYSEAKISLWQFKISSSPCTNTSADWNTWQFKMEGGAGSDPVVRVIFHILLCEEWQAYNHKSDCADAQTFFYSSRPSNTQSSTPRVLAAQLGQCY